MVVADMQAVTRSRAVTILAVTSCLLLLVSPAARSVDGHTCAGLAATIVGTAGDDHIDGTAGDDVIVALGGDDNILGKDGNDTICAGPGDDSIKGGAGDDLIIGGDGSDTVSYAGAPAGVTVDLMAGTATGGEGTDELRRIQNVIGSAHDDTLLGTPGRNTIFGLEGDDVLRGRDGQDELRGGSGNDDLAGGGGDDVVDGGKDVDLANFASSPAPMWINLAAGVAIGEGADVLISIRDVMGSPHDDEIHGDERNNVLWGLGGDDELRGKEGKDVHRGGAGTDFANGGSEFDICFTEASLACERRK